MPAAKALLEQRAHFVGTTRPLENLCLTLSYRSEVRIERVKGPVRRAYLPEERQPVIFGVHGAVAEHYKVPPAILEPHATTLDYVVAAAAG